MYLSRPNNPVRNDYAGAALVIKDLEVYCQTMNSNMTSIETECSNLREAISQERQLNRQLVDFATWVIAQNPKAIHEYKSVTTTLNALDGRDLADEVQTSAGP